jgi:hypothetical protein
MMRLGEIERLSRRSHAAKMAAQSDDAVVAD